MNIAQVVDKFLPITEPWIYSQIKGLKKYNISSKIFCHRIINSNNFKHNNIFSYKNLSYYKISYYRTMDAFKKQDGATLYWNDILKNKKVNLVHSHFGWAAQKGIDLAIKNNLPHVVTFYGADVTRDPLDPHKLAYKNKLSLIFNYSKIILCTSYFLKNNLIKLGASENKIIVWRPGVDFNLFHESVNNINKIFKIISIGRFVPWKGQKYLIKAISKVIKKHEKVQVTFIGEGSTLNECKQFVNKLNLSQKINFLGKLNHKDVAKNLSESNLLVQPSFTNFDGNNESLGMTLVEASACKIPLVASNSGGIPEIVINGKTGLLFEERNSNQLADKIITLIENRKLANTLGRNANIHVNNLFNMDIQIKKLYDILLNVTK